MSRKGKLPIPIPKDVDVKISDLEISVKGPKGTLKQAIKTGIKVQREGNELNVILADDAEDMGNYHGLYRTLIANMISGTTTGFQTKLEMIGVGYRAAVQGKNIDLQIGFSHPTKIAIPEGIHVVVEKNTQITVSGSNKQEVGQFAATIRAKRPPEPYQGKGIRYSGEFVRKKAGKAAAKK